jgi:hypothetical protein
LQAGFVYYRHCNKPTAAQQGAAPDRLQLRSSFLLTSLPAAGEFVVGPLRAAWLCVIKVTIVEITNMNNTHRFLLTVAATAILKGSALAQEAPATPTDPTEAVIPSPAPKHKMQQDEIGLWGKIVAFDSAIGELKLQAKGFELPNGRRAAFPQFKDKAVRLMADAALLGAENHLLLRADVQSGDWVFVVGLDEGSGTALNARFLLDYGETAPAFSAQILPDPTNSSIAPALPLRLPLRKTQSPVLKKVEDEGRYAGYVIRRFPLNHYSLQISYRAKGHTASQALRRGVSERAIYAFGGGYFQPGTKRSIDYIVVEGQQVDDYRWDWGRPVITVTNGQVRIVRPKRFQDIKGQFDFALAVDYKATNRNAVAGRQIFGLTDTEMIFVRCYSTETAARRTMARLGIKDYVFLDGGSSTPPSSRIPTRLVVVWRPNVAENLVASR